MAKATGIGSQARGKVGNVIYYLGKNRAGRYEQVVKSYQPVVANPQSYAQALARVPVGPVQRVCSALLSLIQRGFEGTAYGDPSKSEFLSYNLKYFRGPFMVKGSVIVPPGPMLIAKGSLRSINVAEIDSTIDTGYVEYDLDYRLATASPTKGQIAQELLNRNTWLKQGEQLTFVIVSLRAGEYVYNYESLFLDPSDTSNPRGCLLWARANEHMFSLAAEDAPDGTIFVAAACIRSQAYGESSFKRSTTFLTISDTVYLYNDDAAVQAAVASYRTGEDPEDWEDDPTPEYQQLAYLCMVTLTEDMVNASDWAGASGKQCLGYVTKGGEMGIFYKYSSSYNAYCLVDGQAAIMTYSSGGFTRGIRYSGSYQPAREYSSIYGTM